MNKNRLHIRLAGAVSLAAMLGGCAIYDVPYDAPQRSYDGPYYESYGYPDDYRGPGYYGPGYYQPGYYGGYWYRGGYYSPAPGGYYAPYPYYPGTHVIIEGHSPDRGYDHRDNRDDHEDHGNRGQDRDHERDSPGNGDPRGIYKAPHDPVPPPPQQDGREPPRPYGSQYPSNEDNRRQEHGNAPVVTIPYQGGQQSVTPAPQQQPQPPRRGPPSGPRIRTPDDDQFAPQGRTGSDRVAVPRVLER